MDSKESYTPSEVAELLLRMNTITTIATISGGHSQEERDLVGKLLQVAIPQNVLDSFEKIYLERVPPIIEKISAETNKLQDETERLYGKRRRH